MNIDMKAVAGTEILAGALLGRSAFAKLLEMTAKEPKEPEIVFLDFAAVELATASFMRESVIAFRNMIRGRESAYYPVIANVNDLVRDELVELARSRGDVFATCFLDVNGRPHDFDLIGELEPKQRVTFDLVREHGETDAGELMRVYGAKERVSHATAWNNRLASLAELGLLMEIRQGRSKRYKPIFEEV